MTGSSSQERSRRRDAACVTARRLTFLALLASPMACASRSGSQSPALLIPSPAVEREVVATVQRFFDAMRARDTASLRALTAPDLVVMASIEPGSPETAPTIRSQSRAAFLAAMGGSSIELRERMWSPEVRTDGGIASLITRYDFHRGSEFSHCGVDAFQLVRQPTGWIVSGLAYTVRRTGCTSPP